MEDVFTRAMLANVHINTWEARKHDRQVTDAAHATFHADTGAGRYHKRLFGGREQRISAISGAAQKARAMHHAQTLPWSEDGWRLLPTANYMAYTEAMRKARTRFDTSCQEFFEDYNQLVRHAETKLGRMYHRTDYPHLTAVQHKYHFDVSFSPIPSGDDFRISLPKQEMARITKEVEQRVNEAVKDAMQEAWARLGSTVEHLRDRLDGDGKHLRETLVTKVRDVAETLGRLNLTEDPKLEKARLQVLESLSKLQVGTLRDDDKQRAAAVKKADTILRQMKGMYA